MQRSDTVEALGRPDIVALRAPDGSCADRALELNPNGMFYAHDVERREEDAEHAVVCCQEGRKKLQRSSRNIQARYLLGADGGRFLVDQLGIAMAGESDRVDMVTAHTMATISQHHPDVSIFLHRFIRPEPGDGLQRGYLYHLGPYPADRATEEWVFACARLPHEQTQPWTKEDMLSRLNRTLEISDLSVGLVSISHWFVNAKVAESYRNKGSLVFLIGDAAHRIPPWRAPGLSSSIEDADNLVWKLAMAPKHPEMGLEQPLANYDAERSPIGERVTSLKHRGYHRKAPGLPRRC